MGEAIHISAGNGRLNRLKTNLKVWVIYSSDRFHYHIKQELTQCESVFIEAFSLASLTESYVQTLDAPDLIFVEVGEGWSNRMIELQQYSLSWGEHESSLIVFGDETESGVLKTALRIGASDFLSDQVTIAGLMPLLVKTASDKLESLSYGELFLFINTKGGMGATTLALNSAVELAKHHPNDVLLLDIDLQFGVIPDYLNVQPSYSIADAISISSELDEVSLSSLVHKHESGLHILSFKHENSADDYEQAKKIGQLLPILRRFYSYTILDLSRGLEHEFSAGVSSATRVFLVTQQNLVSLRNCSRMLKLLNFELGVPKEVVEVIVNRYEKRQSIKKIDIEQTVGSRPLHLVPNDFKVAIDSANLGQPFVSSKKRSVITRSIIDFSNKIVPQENEGKSWFSRLFS